MSAFERLWADLNPGLIRYLRVVAVADADDIACESWVDVVRRLPTFEGDETAWRAEVFGAARMHAEDENQRRVWDAMAEDEQVAAVLAEPLPMGDEPFEGDEVEGGPAQGLRLALEAIRDLPPEQGDVLMLRRVAELPEDDVAALVGSDTATVHALEQQALDRLGLDAELLGWALAAEPRPVELADEATIVGFFRAMVPEQPATGTVALRTRARRAAESGVTAAGVTTADVTRTVSTAAGAASARVITLPKPTWRARAGAVAAVSAGVIGLGAISAAAYQGALPGPMQNVMHVVIGAPEPTPETGRSSASKKSHKMKTGPRATATSLAGPVPATAATSALVGGPSAAGLGLCNAWAAQLARPGAPAQASSPVFTSLAKLAGGPQQVVLYCALNNVSLPPLPAATAAPHTVTATQAKPSASPTVQVTTKAKAPQTQKPRPTKSTPPKPPPSKPTVTANPTTPPSNPTATTTVVPPPTATTNGGGPPAGAGTGGGNGKATGAKGTGSGAAKEPAAGQAKPNARAADASAAANDQE